MLQREFIELIILATFFAVKNHLIDKSPKLLVMPAVILK